MNDDFDGTTGEQDADSGGAIEAQGAENAEEAPEAGSGEENASEGD